MVILKKCCEYDYNLVKEIISDSFEKLHTFDGIDENKKVFIKLNCVGPFNKDLGITTHPTILKAVIDLVKEHTNNITVGDNPACRDLTFVLKKCGLYDTVIEENVKILEGTNFTKITNSNPKLYSEFEVSKEMIDCDLFINLPKLKTHSLAYMTCAEKNFFGLIYGLNKAGWHAKASNPLDFGEAINDLYGAFLEALKGKTIVHVLDGIVGLEGEGPSTGGKTKKANCLLISDDAISVDRVALEVAHLDYSKLFINQIAARRGYGESNLDSIELVGDSLDEFKDIHFLAPKDSLSNVGLRFLKIKPVRALLLEHPHVNKDKCIRCGECAKICPPHAMSIVKGEYPHLKSLNCIRCWCCQEVCPQNAISKTKRPIIGKIVFKEDKKN